MFLGVLNHLMALYLLNHLIIFKDVITHLLILVIFMPSCPSCPSSHLIIFYAQPPELSQFSSYYFYSQLPELSQFSSYYFLCPAARAVPVLCGSDAHPAVAHLGQPRHQRELGPGRAGRHGDDAQQDRPGGHALQTLMRGTRRHGE